MRNGFFDGVWVSFVRKKILDNPDKNFVIPDVRFTNESKLFKEWAVRYGVKRGPILVVSSIRRFRH